VATLHRLREQIQARARSGRNGGLSLDEALLREAWDRYIARLTEQNNHSSAANFRNARLAITSATSFEILTDTNLQQRFIEQERGGLVDHLQAFFNNRNITYQVILETPQDALAPAERPLTRKEQYQRMAAEFPLVRELRERLGLDLE
jgi:DNA polymerase-3 subunit gamma/tau